MKTRIDNIRMNTLITNGKELKKWKKNLTENWNDINFYDRSDNFTFEDRTNHHYEDDRISFDYTYIVRGYEHWDCGHDGCEFTYELCLVPVFDSLNEDYQESIREEDVDDLGAFDVANYGCEIVMGMIRTLNEWPDFDIVALAASAIPDCEKHIYKNVDKNFCRLEDWIN